MSVVVTFDCRLMDALQEVQAVQFFGIICV